MDSFTLVGMDMVITGEEQQQQQPPQQPAQHQHQQPEEGDSIKIQHKVRQQMLLMQLDKLRATDRKRQQCTNYESDRRTDSHTFLDDEEGSFLDHHLTETDHLRHRHSTNPSVNKWLGSLLSCLDQAQQYVKRQGRKTEEWSKLFPSASHSFESRCSDLRQDLLRLELNIERFQNVFSKQLDSTEAKMRSFIRDFHLESFELDKEDVIGDSRDEGSSFNHASGSVDLHDQEGSRLSWDRSNNNKLDPTSKDTFPEDLGENEGETPLIDCRDMEPVPEIRDVNSDSPIPVDEMTGDISYINLEEDDESKYIFVKSISTRVTPSSSPISSTMKPTVTIKPVKLSSASKGKDQSKTPPSTRTNHSTRYSTKRNNPSTSENPSQAKLRTYKKRKA